MFCVASLCCGAEGQAGAQINEFKSVRRTPCTLASLCGQPNGHIINNEHCGFIKWRPGFWFFSHGGSHPAPTSCFTRHHTYLPTLLPAVSQLIVL